MSFATRFAGLLYRTVAPPARAADPPPDQIEFVGPLSRWSAVLPEGPLRIDAAGPLITSPANNMVTGPSPRLGCMVPDDDGCPVDILIRAPGKKRAFYRLRLGSARAADLAALGLSLPSGEIQLWAARKSSDGKYISACGSNLYVDAALANGDGGGIAVVMPPPDAPPPSCAQPEERTANSSEKQIHLATWTTGITTAAGTPADPQFIFGPLEDVVDVLLVRLDVQGVLPNAFTAAWVANLLLDREIGRALIRTEEHNGRLAERLCRWLPPQGVFRDHPRWTRIEVSDELTPCLAALPTAYPFLHRAYDGFREKLSQVGWGEDIASRSFMYSMVGTARNSFLLEQLAARYGWGSTPVLADLGGGFGFLGLEMAAKGWRVAIGDSDPAKTELVGPWLRARSPRPLPLEFYTRTIDDIPTEGVPGTAAPHVISFFHSLLMANRMRAPEIVRTCWERLAPGGALVIHELVQGAPGEQPPHVFHQQELVRLISENAAPPAYFSIEDGVPSKIFVPGSSLIVARRQPCG